MSIDGYAAGADQSLERPFGAGGVHLHGWLYPERMFCQMIGQQGGTEGLDNDFAVRGDANVGATSEELPCQPDGLSGHRGYRGDVLRLRITE